MTDILLLKSKLTYDESSKSAADKLRSTDPDCIRAGNNNISVKKRWLHNAILTLTYKGIK